MHIKVENLVYEYMPGTPFEHTAVNDVSFEIKSGEFVGLVGHTGSGKSTLIQHLNGLIKPTSGKIFVDGTDISGKDVKLHELRFKVGIVFQYPEYQLFEETVKKDIMFGPKNMGLSDEEAEERARAAMELVGLDISLAEKSPFELSGGQKRRVAIAGVLAMEPEVLILDEPAAGLDPHGRNEILSRIEYMHKEKNMSIILVSHSMEDIARMAERVIVMKEGKIAAEGSVHDIFGLGDALKEINLDVPQIKRLTDELRSRGYDLPDDIYTVERAHEEILKLFGREN